MKFKTGLVICLAALIMLGIIGTLALCCGDKEKPNNGEILQEQDSESKNEFESKDIPSSVTINYNYGT